MTASPGLIVFQCLTFAMVATVYSVALALAARWDTTTRGLRDSRVAIEATILTFIGVMLIMISLPSRSQTGTLGYLPAITTSIVVFAGAALWLHQRLHACRRNRRVEELHCEGCGYDVRSARSEVCPECGAALPRR